MSVEQGFLDQLAANPGDDVTRLVYADWLDENSDPRGAYLRAEQEVAGTSEADPLFADRERDLLERCRAVDHAWVQAAGKRWDVWLIGYSPYLKIFTIKILRELTACGLAEGKTMVESLPARVIASCSRAQAEAVRERFADCRLHPSGDSVPYVYVSLRPCPEPSVVPCSCFPESFELVILGHRPRRKTALIEAIRTRFFYYDDAHARGLVNSGHSFTVRRYPTEADARAAATQLEDSALLEVRRVERQPVNLPALPPMSPPIPRPAVVGSGPFQVRVLGYPAPRKIGIIKAIRELNPGMGLATAKAISEQGAPIIVYQGNDAEAAALARRIFTDLEAEVELVSSPS